MQAYHAAAAAVLEQGTKLHETSPTMWLTRHIDIRLSVDVNAGFLGDLDWDDVIVL